MEAFERNSLLFVMANPPLSDLAQLPLELLVDSGHSSGTRFRARDSMGALRGDQAALDAAYTRGHADGTEEGREEGLDIVRTTLLELLETKFGEVSEDALELIEVADHAHLRRLIVRASISEEIAQVFPV